MSKNLIERFNKAHVTDRPLYDANGGKMKS